ncbi:MAG: adventurous gliding motility protein CglE [Myxococcales bacterium]|nr:adventurous gliding motility protein CglE [Myxococcales bacterium]
MRKFATLLIALLLSTTAVAATPSEGVPLKVRRGFFTETDIGGILTVGGDDGYSNLQVYLQLGLGYQFALKEGMGIIPVGFHVGIGANAANCHAGKTNGGVCNSSDNFTMTFLSVSAGYLHRVVERLYLGGKIIGGYTLLDPEPVAGVNGGVNIGVAASLEYATNMDHFSVGVDVSYRIIIGPNINVLAFFPRVQYTF